MYFLPKLFKHFRLTSKKNCTIHRKSKVMGGCTLTNVEIGKYSYIGSNSKIAYAQVGNFCSISEDCIIGGGSHPVHFVSTSPVFLKGKNCLKTNFGNIEFEPFKKTLIGNDVWIGSSCLIKGGVSIGNGAIIGMGSVVTHDIPPYEVWAGNPAHRIKKRFSDDVILALQESKWWDFNDCVIRQVGETISSPYEFLEKLERTK